jgi:hypothetical protein
MCAGQGRDVIWTRHTRPPPDLTPAVRGWLRAAGFTEEAYEQPAGTAQGISMHRLDGPVLPFAPGTRLFAFVPDALAARPGPVP